ncbi:FAST kinase domain-containing protein 1, mitochondrial-like [Glandiceps talaboti]
MRILTFTGRVGSLLNITRSLCIRRKPTNTYKQGQRCVSVCAALFCTARQGRHHTTSLYSERQRGHLTASLCSERQQEQCYSTKSDIHENLTDSFIDIPLSCVKQLHQAETETDVFGLLERRTNPMTCFLASTAVTQLWHIQREKPVHGRNIDELNNHCTYKELLSNLETDFSKCDNNSLTSALYSLLHLDVDGSSVLIQRLVQETHRRMHNFELSDLGKFASCLRYLGLYNSSTVGEIADILKERLNEITDEDLQSFSTLMNAVMDVSSRTFQEELMIKALQLLEFQCLEDGNIRRILSAVTGCQNPNMDLVKRCMDLLQEKITEFDIKWLYKLYRSCRVLVYHNNDLKEKFLVRVEELFSQCDDLDDLSKLFEIAINYGPGDLTSNIENRVIHILPDMALASLIRLCRALKQSANNYWSKPLIENLAKALHRKLPEATKSQVTKISKHGLLLRNLTPASVSFIQNKLLEELRDTINPHDVPNLLTSLSLLPVSLFDCSDLILKKVKSSLHQYDFKELHKATKALQRILNNRYMDPHIINKAKFQEIIQELSLRSLDLLKTTNVGPKRTSLSSVDGCFDNEFLEWTELPQVCNFLFYNRYRFSIVLDNIAEMLPNYSKRMSLCQLDSVISAYSGLNYHPSNADVLYQACIQQCVVNLHQSPDPCLIVSVAHHLALAQYFPESILRTIFSLEFLRSLDQMIENLPEGFGNSVQHKLLELNRCVKLERPDINVPWLHDSYIDIVQRGKYTKSAVVKGIGGYLSSVLGGPQYLRKSVLTPYLYSLSFEAILSSDNTPLVCSEYGSVLNMKHHNPGNSQWGVQTKELPSGAQRVAIDYRGAKSYCSNAHYPLGSQEMKRRHLEILGYRYVTIPHFEWNSMVLSSTEDYENYLRNKIFHHK